MRSYVPEAFGSTYEREVAFPRSVWAERLSTPGNATLICEADGDSCGMVTVVRDDNDSQLAWLSGCGSCRQREVLAGPICL